MITATVNALAAPFGPVASSALRYSRADRPIEVDTTMRQHNTSLIRACAETIRLWHEQYGLARRPPFMRDENVQRYRERIERFHRADLSDPHAQEAIANEQQSGSFEVHYGETIPRELWREVASRFEVDHEPPRHLGEAARRILDGLESQRAPEVSEPRLTVDAGTRERLLEHAAEFYKDVAAEQTPALGGVNALISCSLQRQAWDPNLGRATLLHPHVLGLRLVAARERPDDLIDAVRLGDVIVESVIGGPEE